MKKRTRNCKCQKQLELKELIQENHQCDCNGSCNQGKRNKKRNMKENKEESS